MEGYPKDLTQLLVAWSSGDRRALEELMPLVFDEPYPVQGGTITLVSARPEKWSERRRPRNEYRFVFAGG